MHKALQLAGMLALYPCLTSAGRAHIIGIPECAKNGHGTAKTVGEVNDESCQQSALQMYKRGGDVVKTSKSGCDNIYTSGDCSVMLCDIGDHKQTEISVGVLGTAAQLIHAYCRLTGKVGGQVQVDAPDGGKVLVQLGNRPKDELKPRAIEPSEPSVELAPVRARYVSRSDEGDYEQAQGVSEGGAFMHDEITMIDMMELERRFLWSVREVRFQQNPNWQNTAAAQHVIDRGNGHTITIAMAFVTRRGHTMRDMDPDERRNRVNFSDIINQFLGNWRGNGLRGIYTSHVWRNRPDGHHNDHGDLVIVATEGRRPLLLPANGS